MPERPDEALSEDDLEDVVGGIGGGVLTDPLEVNSGYPGDDVETESSTNASMNPIAPFTPIVYD
jgi:hypothetical protein